MSINTPFSQSALVLKIFLNFKRRNISIEMMLMYVHMFEYVNSLKPVWVKSSANPEICTLCQKLDSSIRVDRVHNQGLNAILIHNVNVVSAFGIFVFMYANWSIVVYCLISSYPYRGYISSESAKIYIIFFSIEYNLYLSRLIQK